MNSTYRKTFHNVNSSNDLTEVYREPKPRVYRRETEWSRKEVEEKKFQSPQRTNLEFPPSPEEGQTAVHWGSKVERLNHASYCHKWFSFKAQSTQEAIQQRKTPTVLFPLAKNGERRNQEGLWLPQENIIEGKSPNRRILLRSILGTSVYTCHSGCLLAAVICHLQGLHPPPCLTRELRL